VFAALAASAPVRENGQLPPADAFLVAQLARTLVRLDRLAAWLDQHGIQDRRGKIRSAARWESKLTSQAVSMMSALGMSPTSRAKLGLNLARTISLAEAMSEPNPQRRTELLRQAGVGGVDDV
jgi:phage terminase small subunit